MSFFSVIPFVSFGAELSVLPDDDHFYIGKDFLVEVVINPEGESLNAISGLIVFEERMLEIKEVRDGNSALNFWIEKPAINDSGSVSFSGITPGGFAQGENILFTLIFSPKSEGKTKIGFDKIQVLRNDGSGTSADIEIKNLEFFTKNEKRSRQVVPVDDFESPEPFFPMVASDPEIFGGKYFLVFSAQDKGSGIDHYEVREGFLGDYQKSESPYLIKDQSLSKKIYVKAIDRFANERIAVFKNPVSWYQDYKILAIIFIATVLVSIFWKLWKKIYGRK